MYLLLPAFLLIMIIILFFVKAKIQQRKTFQSLSTGKYVAVIFIWAVNIFFGITFLFALIPVASEYMLDEMRIMIIQDKMSLDIPDAQLGMKTVDVLTYPVLDQESIGFGWSFKVADNSKFVNHLTALETYRSVTTVDDMDIYTLNVEGANCYLIYYHSTDHYRLEPGIVWYHVFNPDSGWTPDDYIPVIPCTYFSEQEIGVVDTTPVTYQTSYSWEETKAFYQNLATDQISIDDGQNKVYYTSSGNSGSGNEFALTYYDGTITLDIIPNQ